MKIECNYPASFDSEFKSWAEKQPFPWGYRVKSPSLSKEITLEGYVCNVVAMPIEAWKSNNYKVKKGEKALFWLGNLPWWSARQVQYIEGFMHWRQRPKIRPSDLEAAAKYEGWGDDWEYEAGDGMGGPFY
jgi:hypothetical protein